MERGRLKYVDDISPLFVPGALPPYDATRWAAEAQMSKENIVYHPHGFTVTVLKNPLITWHRSFSTDNRLVPLPTTSSRSLIHINEWLPGFQNNITERNFFAFGTPRRHGIAELPKEGPVTANWRSHAKRHLKHFESQHEVTLRQGTFQEIEEPYFRSQIPSHMKAGLWRLGLRHLKDHPETLEVLIAESKTDGIVAGIVSGTCKEASTSFYLMGFYLPSANKAYPMVGLMRWWFERTRAKGLSLCNFGDMCGPKFLPWQQDLGYSYFKTHFGIRRVWYPRNHWRITFPFFQNPKQEN